jgi:DNA-directed RNA polymerase subunit N (RpoN/RPB10)
MYRCFTCGLPLAPYYFMITRMICDGFDWSESFQSVGIDRQCCRTMCLTMVDTTRRQQAAQYTGESESKLGQRRDAPLGAHTLVRHDSRHD